MTIKSEKNIAEMFLISNAMKKSEVPLKQMGKIHMYVCL